MRSMAQIINLVIDGEITTKEQAAALVEEEVRDRVAFYYISHVTAEQARTSLLMQIGYVTGYCSHEQADKIMELFDTEHPVFGRQHPTPEDAFRMGQEYAERKRRTIDDNQGS
jgi:hypothetical protein